MSPPSYYFINHTRKEFAYFDTETLTIFKILEIALKNYVGWTSTDDIRIDSELSDSCELVMHLINNLGYTDLDFQDYE